MEPPVISVVIPCRGHAGELRSCLTALQQQANAPPYEVIVVNSDGDPAVTSVAAGFTGIRLIVDGSGLYPGAARNRGAREARGAYFAFIDADCIPAPDWLAAMFDALQTGMTVLAGAVLDARPCHPVAASDNLLQFVDFSPRRPSGPAAHVAACNFGIRAGAFVELKGFVADVPIGEDGLFSDAAAARWRDGVRFVNTVRVRHAGRATVLSFWRHQWLFGFYRGRVGSRLRPVYRRWGRSLVGVIPAVCIRLSYLVRQTARWHPAGVMRVLLLLPILLSGLIVWAFGFRQGCRAASR